MADAAPSPAAEGGGQAEAVVDEQGQQTQGASGGEAAGAPGEVAPANKEPRVRRERLPGVVTRDDGDDIFPELGFKSNTGKRVDRKTAARELDQEMREEHGVSPLDIPELPEGAKAEGVVKPEAKKIKFGDKEYESIEQAEQSFKSLQGMFKPMQDRLTRAEQLAEQAAESARSWRQRAIELEGAPPQQPQTQNVQAKPTTETSQAELEKALSRVNGELFESLAREHGLPLAGRYLAAQVLATVHDDMLPALREEIMASLRPELEPLKQDRGFQQATQHVAGLIETVGQYKNHDGSDAFPELQDQQSVTEIGELWVSMDMPAELALTPKGLLQAVALYRMYKGQMGRSATTTPTVQVSEPARLAPPAAGASLEAGGRSIAPGAGRSEGDATSRFARSLDDAPVVDKLLGFQIRRRR
jgi:hypothetical protein